MKKINKYIEEIKEEILEKRIPLKVHIDLTYRCNLKCKHCYLNNAKNKEMNSAKIKSIIKQAKDIGCLQIIFSGGEIFLRKDIIELIKFVSDLNMLSIIRTNGILITNKLIKDLKKIPLLRKIVISLYGFDANSHDEITNKKGSFKKTMENIEKLLKSKLPIAIHFVATKNKTKYLPKIIKYCNNRNIELLHSSCLHSCLDGDQKPLSLNITKDEFSNYYDNFEVFDPKSDLNKLEKGYVCIGGLKEYYISPSGKVYPCTQWRKELGDINKEKLVDIIKKNRKVFKVIRFIDRKDCLNCKYLRYCIFCPANAEMETGKPNLPYKNACYLGKIRYNYFKRRRENEKNKTKNFEKRRSAESNGCM